MAAPCFRPVSVPAWSPRSRYFRSFPACAVVGACTLCRPPRRPPGACGCCRPPPPLPNLPSRARAELIDTAMQQRCRAIIILLTIGISAWSGFLNLVHRSNNKKHQQQHQPQRRHRSLKGVSSFFDPHTTVPKVNEKEQIWLNELKSAEPSISQHRPTEPGAVAVDVVSIGSQTRPAYVSLHAVSDTHFRPIFPPL